MRRTNSLPWQPYAGTPPEPVNPGGWLHFTPSDSEKDAVLTGLDQGSITLQDIDGKSFFEMVVKDIQQGFFADPIYVGNREMVAWRMIGFPGARYDYRDWVSRHNERYPRPPVSITGRTGWSPQKG